MQASHPVCTHTAFVCRSATPVLHPLCCCVVHATCRCSAVRRWCLATWHRTTPTARRWGAQAAWRRCLCSQTCRTRSCKPTRAGRSPILPGTRATKSASVASLCPCSPCVNTTRCVAVASEQYHREANAHRPFFRCTIASSCFAEGRSVPCTASAGQLAVLSAHEPLPCV